MICQPPVTTKLIYTSCTSCSVPHTLTVAPMRNIQGRRQRLDMDTPGRVVRHDPRQASRACYALCISNSHCYFISFINFSCIQIIQRGSNAIELSLRRRHFTSLPGSDPCIVKKLIMKGVTFLDGASLVCWKKFYLIFPRRVKTINCYSHQIQYYLVIIIIYSFSNFTIVSYIGTLDKISKNNNNSYRKSLKLYL